MKHVVWKLILRNKVIFRPNVDKTPSEGDASIVIISNLLRQDKWKRIIITVLQ